MTTLIRTLLLFAYSLFWGGLTFYAGVVLRINHEVIADPMYGGMITQRVTGLLQILAGVTVVLMLWNAIQVSRTSRRFAASLTLCTLILGGALVGLCAVHRQLDAVIDLKAVEITNREAFTINHRRYNQLTTVEWIATLVYLPVTVAAWRKVDGSCQSEKRNSR